MELKSIEQFLEEKYGSVDESSDKAKKELSDFEKKIAQEKFMDKFSKLIESIKSKEINENWKVKSNMAVLITLAQCKDRIEDVKIKDMLQGVMDYLSKEFNIPLK